MTKYMKVAAQYSGASTQEIYIDLHKINRIRAGYIDANDYGGISVDNGRGYQDHLGGPLKYFKTHFSVPGERDMTVFGPPQKFIAHIEEQQKRARKGKEIEAYNPDWDTVYTENGNVHPANELLEPSVEYCQRHRSINIQTGEYIEQIRALEEEDGKLYGGWNVPGEPPTYGTFNPGKVLDLFSEAQDKLSVVNLRFLHKIVNPIVMKAMKHSQSANDTTSISTGM